MNKKALVIGIDNYPSKPLTGCVNDARAIAQLFARHGNGEPNFDVELITAPQPNADGSIPSGHRSGNGKLPERRHHTVMLRQKDPRLVQGRQLRYHTVLFFRPWHDYQHRRPCDYNGFHRSYDEGIPMDEILGYANESKAREKIIILDCCHSGAFGSPTISGKNVSKFLKE